MTLKILNLKLEPLSQEQITLPISIKGKFIFSEDTEEWAMKEQRSTICTTLILKPLNGLNLTILKEVFLELEEATHLQC